MKALKKMKENQSGFTLVEIIVVLVILAVLAAFTIPTMLGFVEEAKAKAYIAEAREVYVAAQATATEYTANGTVFTEEKPLEYLLSSIGVYQTGWSSGKIPAALTMRNYLGGDIEDISGVAYSEAEPPIQRWQIENGESYWRVSLEDGKITKLEYYKYKHKITIEAGGSTSVVKIF